MNQAQLTGMKRTFGEAGILEDYGFPRRESQVVMAKAVCDVIDGIENHVDGTQHILIEGPCGVGKSLSYLIPGIEHAARTGGTVIVATANIALQEQLYYKDLPMLKAMLPWDFEFALVKGRSNFLCRHRYDDYTNENQLYASDESREIKQKLIGWAESTETGDKSELTFNPKQEWSNVSVSGNECLKAKCPLVGECYANRARQGLARAQVIVVNYHLLMTDFKLDGEVLPPFDVLICDEAHQITEIARAFQSGEVSESKSKWLAGRLNKYIEQDVIEKFQTSIRDLLQLIQAQMKDFKEKRRIQPGELNITVALKRIDELLREVRLKAKSDTTAERDSANLEMLATSLSEFRKAVERIGAGSTDDFVVWSENDGFATAAKQWKLTVKFSPIDVSDWIGSKLFDDKHATVLTSATMTTLGNFNYIASQVGAPKDIKTLKLKSPFDLKNNGLLFIPDRNDRSKDFDDSETAELMMRAIDCTKGGVLCLFTSFKSLNNCSRLLADRIRQSGRNLMLQENKSRQLVLEEFKQDTNSVLFATKSFFEGVDVAGDALQTVIMDKLPFPVPDDPVLAAIQQLIEKKGMSGWNNFIMPLTGIVLAQAAGRLIRSITDKGTFVLLDNRIVNKPYGQLLLKSLPPFQYTNNWDKFRQFMESI